MPAKEPEFVSLLKWGRVAWFYDTLLLLSGLGPRFRNKISRGASEKAAAQTIADIGCGTGLHFSSLRTHFPTATIYGVDPDPSNLNRIVEQGRLLDNRIILHQCGAEQTPFSDGEIDVCFSTLTFHHLTSEQKQAAFQEVFRIVRHDGLFILTDWGPSPVEFLRWLLIFENQKLLDDHASGKILEYATQAGFELAHSVKVKPTGIWTWTFKKRSKEASLVS